MLFSRRPKEDHPLSAVEFEPEPSHDVVSSADNPLHWWQRLGVKALLRSGFLSEQPWRGAEHFELVLFYLTGKRSWTEDILPLMPWFCLSVFQGFLAAACVEKGAERFFLVWFLIEVLAGTLLAGVFTQMMLFQHLRRVTRAIRLEELAVTKLRPEDILAGLAIRPLAVQAAGAYLNNVWLLLLILYVSASSLGTLNVEMLFVFGPFYAAGLWYRWEMFVNAQKTAGSLAMRTVLATGRTDRALRGMTLQWIGPWGLLPMAAPVVFTVVMLLIFVSGGRMASILVSFLALLLLMVMGALPIWMGAYGRHVLTSAVRSSHRWWMYGGEEAVD